MQTPFALRLSKRTVKTAGMNRTKDPLRLSCANGKSWFFGGGLEKSYFLEVCLQQQAADMEGWCYY